MKKRILSKIILMCIIICTSFNAYAASNVEKDVSIKASIAEVKDNGIDDITKEKALSILENFIKNKLSIQFDKEKYSVFLEKMQDNYLFVTLTNDSMDEQNKFNKIEGILNYDTGKVKQIIILKNNRNKNRISTTREEAFTIAREFMTKNFEDKIKDIYKESEDKAIVRNIYDKIEDTYTISFYRSIEGKEYRDNYINVVVDCYSEKVLGFDYRWDDELNISKDQVKVSSAQAMETIKKYSDAVLEYSSQYQNECGKREYGGEVKAVYTIDYPNFARVDAASNSLYPEVSETKKEYLQLDSSKKEGFYKQYKPTEKLEKPIEKEEALERLNKIAYEILGKDYKMEGLEYKEKKGQFISSINNYNYWEAIFSKVENESITRTLKVCLDVEKGTINFLSKSCGKRTNKGIARNKVYYNALDILAKYYPDKINDVDISIEEEYGVVPEMYINNNYYYYEFIFRRKVNGVNFKENYIKIDIDNTTGELLGLQLNWNDDIKFPSIEKVIDKQTAIDTFSSKYKPMLIYSLVENNVDNNSIIKPFYILEYIHPLKSYSDSNHKSINALDKSIICDEKIRDVCIFYNNIKGNKYKKEILHLFERFKLNEMTFDAEKKVNKLEFIKMLVNGLEDCDEVYFWNPEIELKFKTPFLKDSLDYRYLEYAVKYKIIDNTEDFKFNPEEPVKRSEAAKIFTKLSGYGNILNFKNIFKIDVSDSYEILQEDVGALAICKEVGLLELTNNKIRPKDNILMEETAHAIYIILQNR